MKGFGTNDRRNPWKPGNCADLRLLLFAAVVLAHSAMAVTYTGSLPVTPTRPGHAFCTSFNVALNDLLVDGQQEMDDEYGITSVTQSVHWSVFSSSGTLLAEQDGTSATVTSSLPGGGGIITAPGEYTISFSGTATYYLVRQDGDEQTTEGPFTVGLSSSTGGRLSMPFSFVGVGSVSCEDVMSTTATPGEEETLVVPVNYNNGSLTVTAYPSPSGTWPSAKPVWSGATATAQDAATATISTGTPGTYTVTATCGNCVALTVQVIGVSGLTARRKGSGTAFGASATIAAGGKSSDVHKAEIKIQLNPVPLKQAYLTFPASLTGAAAHQGTNVAAMLTCGNSTITGNATGTVTLGQVDLGTGTATATLKSSNVTRTCTVTIGGQSAGVGMVMAAVGNRKYDWPEYFIYGVSHDIDFFPTLQEAADSDADGDGIPGEGAIDGHGIHFYVKSITVRYWQYDWENFEYIDYGEDETGVSIGEDPLLRYNLRLSDIMDFDDTTETRPGQYTDTETVYGFYDYDDSTCVETSLEVETYMFAVYDDDVYTE